MENSCIKSFNKNGLHHEDDTTWRDGLRLNENVRPEWRALYKPPLEGFRWNNCSQCFYFYFKS